MRLSIKVLPVLCFLTWTGCANAQQPYRNPNQYAGMPMPYPSTNNSYPAPRSYWGSTPGYYNAYPNAPAYPAYSGYPVQPGYVLPAPVPVAGGGFGIKLGGAQLNFWKSPSGYYYPWCQQPAVGYWPSTTVIYMQEGSNKPADPPLPTIFADMKKYLEESKQKNSLSEGSYNHLVLRLSDLMKIEQGCRQEGDGALNANDEADIRSKVNDLGLEITRSIKR
jgi:hypothetical protein